MPEVRGEIQDKSQSVQAIVMMATAMAADYARVGRLPDAELILSDILSSGVESADVYDLLARVYAQMGRYGKAVELWQKAINLDPTNLSINRSLNRALSARQRKIPYRGIIALLAITILFGSVLFFYYYRDTVPDVAVGTPTPIQQEMPNVGGSVVGKSEKLDNVIIDVPHSSKKYVGNKLILSFDQGLFVSGVRLKTEARSLLLQLAQQLQKYSNSVDVSAVGITDDLPVRGAGQYSDNYELGIARAVSVVEVLRSSTALPASLFTLRASVDAPYPNDSMVNRMKNRTVMFVITEKKEND